MRLKVELTDDCCDDGSGGYCYEGEGIEAEVAGILEEMEMETEKKRKAWNSLNTIGCEILWLLILKVTEPCCFKIIWQVIPQFFFGIG